MKNFLIPILVFIGLCWGTFLSAQVNYTANDFIIPYEGVYHPGMNLGYYGPSWNDNTLGDLSAGNETTQTQGVGIKALRGSLPEGLGRTFTYDIWINNYNYNNAIGTTDNTLFLGFASDEHKDPVDYCPGDGFQTDMFANLYEPIWDNGENGTPVNDENYYALYVYEVVSRLHEKVKFWEIWNEPGFDFTGAKGFLPRGQPGNWWENNPDPCDYKLRAPIFHYIRTLRISYEVIKSIAPDDYVCIAGLGFDSFLDALLRNTDNPDDGKVTAEYPLGAGAYFDVVGFHVYPHIDGTTRFWDPVINDFVFTRHSDAAADALETRQVDRQKVLDYYGYDGVTYPRKEWIATEVNVPNKPINQAWGSEEVQRNYVMKVNMKAMDLDFTQIHLFVLGDRIDEDVASNEFDLMGMYKNLFGIGPGQEEVKEAGIGMKTMSDALFGSRFDAAQTAAMSLPANIGGGAYRFDDGTFTYALWAKTQNDLSETSFANYSFPAPLNLSSLVRKEWDYAQTENRINETANNIQLSSAPIFLRRLQDDPDVFLEVSCIMDFETRATATTPEGGARVTWPVPTATTNCPGGVTIAQTQGPANGDFFPFGVHQMQYTITNACGQVKLCAFNVAVASTGGGIGDCNLFRWEMGFVGQFEGNKYFVSKVKKDFVNAQAQAASHGGYLVSIDSPEENEFLRQQVNDLAMIGYNDVAQEGQLGWTSGKDVVFTNVADCQGCQNSDFGDVVMFNHFNGEWYFVGPDAVEYFIMELPCTEVSLSECDAMYMPVCGPDGTEYFNSCTAEEAGVFNYANCVEECDLGQQDWLQDTLSTFLECVSGTFECTTSIESFVFNDTTYVAFYGHIGPCPDFQTDIFSCDGTLFCTEGSIAGLTQCSQYFGSNLPIQGDTLWSIEYCQTSCVLDGQQWLADLISSQEDCSNLDVVISSFIDDGDEYVLYENSSNISPEGVFVIFNCEGTTICTETGIGSPPCSNVFGPDFMPETSVLWSALEQCMVPCDIDGKEWLTDKVEALNCDGCVLSLQSFERNDSVFVVEFRDEALCEIGGYSIRDCEGILVCLEGGTQGSTDCSNMFGDINNFDMEEIWSKEADCEEECDILNQAWIPEYLDSIACSGCIDRVLAIGIDGVQFIMAVGNDNFLECPEMIYATLYDCDGNLYCENGGQLNFPECGFDDNPIDSVFTTLWSKEIDCPECILEDQEWLNNYLELDLCSDCIVSVETYNFLDDQYLVVRGDTENCSDVVDLVLRCDGSTFCTDGGLANLMECNAFFNFAELDEVLWEREEDCESCNDILNQAWVPGYLDSIDCDSCVERVLVIEKEGIQYFMEVPKSNLECYFQTPFFYDCDRTLLCDYENISSECTNFLEFDSKNDTVLDVVWNANEECESCELENQEWVNDYLEQTDLCGECIASVETYSFLEYEYLLVRGDVVNCSGVTDLILKCNNTTLCADDDFDFFTRCSQFFDLADLEEVLWEREVDCEPNATSTLQVQDLSLFPNPASEQIQIHFESKHSASFDVSVLDITGKRISQQEQQVVAGENKIAFSIQSIAEGMYFIQLTDQGTAASISLKFVKSSY